MTITDMLQQWGSGDRDALNRLIPVVEQRLYQLAEYHLQKETTPALQPTELLHEVYLRLSEYEQPHFRDRQHFFGASSSLIRRILVDLSRRKRAAKRDSTVLVNGMPQGIAGGPKPVDVVLLDAALDKLAGLDKRQARIVELRYFGGFSIKETAALLEISTATVKRDWEVAKAWLRRELEQ